MWWQLMEKRMMDQKGTKMIDVIKQLTEIGLQQAEETFVSEFFEQNTERDIQIQGIGLALARWSSWDGLEILKVCYAALEDSNFHSENEKIQELIDSIKGE
jgi:hypothetical protein